jgi:hypothetical protein
MTVLVLVVVVVEDEVESINLVLVTTTYPSVTSFVMNLEDEVKYAEM